MVSVDLPVGPPEAASLPALRATARAWADVLRLPLRRQRWRGSSGEFAGMGVGSSLDFQDHRAYLPGDDPRQINWQAYARTGHYTMKLYREEVRPLVDVILDASASMWAFPAKRARSAELFLFTVESAHRTGASVRVTAVAGTRFHALDEAAIASERWGANVTHFLAPDAASPPPPHAPPAIARLPLRLGSLRVLISDLLFPGAPEAIIHPLVSRQGRAVVLAPSDPQEAAPDWDGNHEFIEAEARSPHPHRLDPATLNRYSQAYRRHFELWKQSALRHGAALAQVPSASDLGSALRLEAVPAGAVEF